MFMSVHQKSSFLNFDSYIPRPTQSLHLIRHFTTYFYSSILMRTLKFSWLFFVKIFVSWFEISLFLLDIVFKAPENGHENLGTAWNNSNIYFDQFSHDSIFDWNTLRCLKTFFKVQFLVLLLKVYMIDS